MADGGLSLITGYLQDFKQNKVIPLSGMELRIGREDTCEIQTDCKLDISRCHGKFKFSDGQWHIQDMSRNGISVNGHPLDRTDLLALKNGDQIILTNETVAVYKFFEQRPQNTGVSETTSAARANNKSGQERVADMTGSTSTTKTTTRIKKQVRIMSRDDEIQISEPLEDRQQPAGMVDENEIQIFNKRLLQATHGRNSLDITRQRWQNMASTQRREIQNLQAEQLQLKTQISGLLEKLSQVEDRRKRSEMELDAATHRNAELQQNLERMTRRDSDIQKILQDEASCSICFEIVVNGHETECHHLFCRSCLSAWRDHGFTCPLCRKVIVVTQESERVNKIVRRLYTALPEQVRRDREVLVDDRRHVQVHRDFNTEDEDDELQLIRMEEQLANLARSHVDVTRTPTTPRQPPAPRTPVNRPGHMPTRFEHTRRQRYQTPYVRPSSRLDRRNLQTSPDFYLQH